MDKWVPVTEKLPTKEGLYIVTMDGGIAGQKEPFTSTGYLKMGNGTMMETALSPGCHCLSRIKLGSIENVRLGEIGYSAIS